MSDTHDFAPSAEEPIASEVGRRIEALLAAAEAAANAVRHEAEQQAAAVRRGAEEEAARYLEERKRDADEQVAQRLRRISEVGEDLLERTQGIAERLDEAEATKRKLRSLVTAIGDAADELARDLEARVARPTLSVVSDEPAADPSPEGAAESSAESADAAEPRASQAEPAEVGRDSKEPALTPLERLKAAAANRAPGEADLERRGRFTHEPAEEAPTTRDDQLLGARLVALQMAVAGSERDDVERHLRAEFEIDDPSSILDEVFGKSGKGAPQ